MAWPHPKLLESYRRPKKWWTQNVTFTVARTLCHFLGHPSNVLIVYRPDEKACDRVWTDPLKDMPIFSKVAVVALKNSHYTLTVVDCAAGTITTQDGFYRSSRQVLKYSGVRKTSIQNEIFHYLGHHLGKTPDEFTYIEEAYMQQVNGDYSNCGPIVVLALWHTVSSTPYDPSIRKGDVFQPKLRISLVKFFLESFQALHSSKNLRPAGGRDRTRSESLAFWSLEEATLNAASAIAPFPYKKVAAKPSQVISLIESDDDEPVMFDVPPLPSTPRLAPRPPSPDAPPIKSALDLPRREPPTHDARGAGAAPGPPSSGAPPSKSEPEPPTHDARVAGAAPGPPSSDMPPSKSVPKPPTGATPGPPSSGAPPSKSQPEPPTHDARGAPSSGAPPSKSEPEPPTHAARVAGAMPGPPSSGAPPSKSEPEPPTHDARCGPPKPKIRLLLHVARPGRRQWGRTRPTLTRNEIGTGGPPPGSSHGRRLLLSRSESSYRLAHAKNRLLQHVARPGRRRWEPTRPALARAGFRARLPSPGKSHGRRRRLCRSECRNRATARSKSIIRVWTPDARPGSCRWGFTRPPTTPIRIGTSRPPPSSSHGRRLLLAWSKSSYSTIQSEKDYL
jgi:hypothetical protein